MLSAREPVTELLEIPRVEDLLVLVSNRDAEYGLAEVHRLADQR